ncbi:MAG TPA: TROVE domain-containing protein [Acidimicrobiales bacterium]|nr:TROVE domain-containing protein [Acidimicrobiales bacterium]
MPKLSGTKRRPLATNVNAPIRTTDARTITHQGGAAFLRDAESDLFLLAVTNLVGEDTFYERAGDRDARFASLVGAVTASNPAFVAGLAPYLRETMRMRSAAIVMAAEYVAAGGPGGRSVIARTLQRADEPAELLGYWLTRHGRNVPMPVKRGIADATRRLYNERAALKYDGLSRQMRMADVIEMTHPAPRDERQSVLFKHLLDRRHHDDARADATYLPVLAAAAELDAVPIDERRAVLRARGGAALADAGFSWERLSGWLPGGMDAEAWEAILPSMGVMALVRNLRNFDQAGISQAAVDTVIAKITSADDIAAARLFPYHVWAAYKNAPSDDWKRALGRALDHTVSNVPALDGTLVVIDTSSSMQAALSARSTIQRVEVAAVMAMASAKRASNVDVVIFGQSNAIVRGLEGMSVLRGVEKVVGSVGSVGHSTFGHTAIARWFDRTRHKRAVIFTDDQQHDSGQVNLDHVPLIYTFNLAGYRPSALPAGARGRCTFGGFTDAMFAAVQVIEKGQDASWPFCRARLAS